MPLGSKKIIEIIKAKIQLFSNEIDARKNMIAELRILGDFTREEQQRKIVSCYHTLVSEFTVLLRDIEEGK